MDNLGDTQIWTIAISLLSLLISFATLYINLKNRETQLNTYFLTRASHRSGNIDLKWVSSEQLENEVLIKLIFFNPGSIASIIQSLTIWREIPSDWRILRWLGQTEWEEVRSARWWPAADPSCKKLKNFADEYKSLYVSDYRELLILIPGYIDRNLYKFLIKTNNGQCSQKCTIDAIKSHFPHTSEQWFYKK